MDNRTLAQRLTDMAHDLEGTHASLFRIRAYRRAAETILSLEKSIEDLVAEGGRKRLREIPNIGVRLSRTIENLVKTEAGSRLEEKDAVRSERGALAPR